MVLIGRFGRPLYVGRSHKKSQACVRPSYKTLNSLQYTVSPKQGLTNQCRREAVVVHLLLAAHGQYGFRHTRRDIAVSRWAGNSATSRVSRGYDGFPGRQHSNHGP